MRSLRHTCTVADDIALERTAVAAALDGDRSAFAALVERHQGRVRGLLQRIVNNAADADDLAQSAFVAAFAALDAFDCERRFSTWLYRIAINLAKDHLKSKKRTESTLDATDVATAVFAGRIAPADELTLARQRRELVAQALATLCLEDRELLVLKDMEELPFDEIHARTGRPVTALKIRAVRARARLRQALTRLAPREAL